MGIFDDVKDAVERTTGVDLEEDHVEYNGFNRQVCHGCQYEGERRCQMCGCFFTALRRWKEGSPPEHCPRLAEHRRRDDRHP